MKNLTFQKLFYATMLVMTTAFFAGCVDDNDDTEAPRLEISPKTLVFNDNGMPVDGSQDYFEISANRNWTAKVLDDKTWVTLSKMEGAGSDKVQVSIPEGITDEATVQIQISNKVGVLMKENVTIRSGNVVPAVLIYNETFGNGNVSTNPDVADYADWNKSGEGSANVTYSAEGVSIRSTGKSNVGAYEGASGPNVALFTKAGTFQVNKITLNTDQTNLRLKFGGNYSYKPEQGDWDNTFSTEKFKVALSSNGTEWVPLYYTKNNGDASDPYWIVATADFTLKQGINNIYIKFTAASESSSIRLDDITLSTGNGGQEIDLGNTNPSALTAAASKISATSATLGGSIVNMDIASATEVGVQYTQYSGDITSINWGEVAKTKAQEKATPWEVAVTGLTEGNQYAFRAYAVTAAGDIYGSIETFIAKSPESITIADLVTKIKATTAATPIDKDYIIQGIICGDPQAQNCSFGTLYIMTKGANTAGNALTLYNTKIQPEDYSLGDEVTAVLRKESATMQMYNSAPQVSGFDETEIQKISSGNTVEPIVITVEQLLDFACMPVKIENVTIETGGVWKKEEGKAFTHTFKANGNDLTVYFNKGANSFNDVPFVSKTGGYLVGIAAAFKTDAQLLPRNLEDVKDFDVTGPTITAVSPTSLSFPSTGGQKEIIVTTVNQGTNTLSVNGLSTPLSASISNNVITVKAEANSGGAIEQTLTITLQGGNSILVKITQEAQGSVTKVYKKVTEAPQDWSGKYLITYTSEDGTTVNLLTGKGSSNIGAYEDISSEYDHSAGTISANEKTTPYTCTIAKTDKEGEYTILLGETYLGLTSKANSLYFGKSATASGYQWKFNDTKIVPVNYDDRNLQWNNSNNQYRFACYTGTQKDVILYKLSE